MNRDDYALTLIPHAVALVGACRSHNAVEIRAILGRVRALPKPPGVSPLVGLVVVLAGMVPDDRTPVELLDWVDWSIPAGAPVTSIRAGWNRQLAAAALSPRRIDREAM